MEDYVLKTLRHLLMRELEVRLNNLEKALKHYDGRTLSSSEEKSYGRRKEQFEKAYDLMEALRNYR